MSENNQRDLELRQWTLTSTVEHFKVGLAKAEAELQEVVDALKALATDSVEAAQSTVETVVDKAEEVVETVKEEVKKAAPKRSTKKTAEKAADEADSSEDSDK